MTLAIQSWTYYPNGVKTLILWTNNSEEIGPLGPIYHPIHLIHRTLLNRLQRIPNFLEMQGHFKEIWGGFLQIQTRMLLILET